MSKNHCARIVFPAVSLAVLFCSAAALCAENLPDRCRLKPVNGSCKAMMDRYYFNQTTGKCKEYIYDGCGTVVPFDTLEECRALCENVKQIDKKTETPNIKPIEQQQSGLVHDPVEDDPRYAEIFRSIDDEVKALLVDHPQRGGEGFVNIYWQTKKNLLKQKYNIDWRSPGEMNSHVLFD